MFRPIILCLLVILTFLLISCGGAEGMVPTLIPTIEGMLGGDQSPRTGPGAAGVPPTWTPPPTRELPTPLPPPPTDAPDESYVIQPGDTLAEIAIRFGVDLQTLIRANNITNMDLIEVGQVLTIPR